MTLKRTIKCDRVCSNKPQEITLKILTKVPPKIFPACKHYITKNNIKV